jgi:hypothetical protein
LEYDINLGFGTYQNLDLYGIAKPRFIFYLKDGNHKIFHLTLSFMLMCTCATSPDRWMMVCLLLVVIEMLQIVASSIYKIYIMSDNLNGTLKSESAKECVTTHLLNQLALKMDGARASGLNLCRLVKQLLTKSTYKV